MNTIDPKVRRSLVAVAVINIVCNIPQVLLVWLQCNPVDALWDPYRQAQCDHRKSVYYTYFVGAVAALSDFYLAIVPIHMLLPLRIDRKLKWGLSFLMGCGIFAGVAAIVRTWAAKFIISEDSSCKSVIQLCKTYTNTGYRRRRHPLPLGRSRRMDRPNHNVHPTRLATLPPLHTPLHQINAQQKQPTELQLQQIQLHPPLQAGTEYNQQRRPVTQPPASACDDDHFDLVDERCGHDCCTVGE